MVSTREDLLGLLLGLFFVVQGVGTLVTVPRRIQYYGPAIGGITGVAAVVLVGLGCGILYLLVSSSASELPAGLPTT